MLFFMVGSGRAGPFFKSTNGYKPPNGPIVLYSFGSITVFYSCVSACTPTPVEDSKLRNPFHSARFTGVFFCFLFLRSIGADEVTRGRWDSIASVLVWWNSGVPTSKYDGNLMDELVEKHLGGRESYVRSKNRAEAPLFSPPYILEEMTERAVTVVGAGLAAARQVWLLQGRFQGLKRRV